MSRELARAVERYREDALSACRTTSHALQAAVGDFYITGWTHKGRQAFREQWLPAQRGRSFKWEWEEIFRRHREPDRLELVVWAPGDRLSALGLVLTTSRAVELRFLEGDQRPDCPLKGHRILIVLEAAARYAQSRGKLEIRVQPINAPLAKVYCDIYRFKEVRPKGEVPYLRREI